MNLRKIRYFAHQAAAAGIIVSLSAAALLIQPSASIAAPNDKTARKSTEKSKKTTPKSKELKAFQESIIKIADAGQQKQYASALVHCQEALKRIPKPIDKKLEQAVQLQCLELYTLNDRHEEALEFASKIRKTQLLPEIFDAVCFTEATSLTKLHRWEEAEAKYRECPGRQDAQKAVIASNAAELALIRGNPEEAVQKYKSSLDLSSVNPHAHFGLASALTRLDRYPEAMYYFMQGVELDPGFSFIQSSFFEPASENDYQTGIRFHALHRSREAAYYLRRSAASEERLPYRKSAQALLDRIQTAVSQKSQPLIASYPIVLPRITQIAVDSTGKRFAFSNVSNEGGKIAATIWTLDSETGKTAKRLTISDDFVTAIAFTGETSEIRVLAGQSHYAFDMSENGIYIYENAPKGFPVAFTADGGMISITAQAHAAASAWLTPFERKDIVELPDGAKRITLSSDFKQMIVNTDLETQFIRVADGSVTKALSADFNVKSTAVHPTKPLAALSIQSGTVITDTTGRLLTMIGSPGLEETTAAAFSPDGRYLATLTQQTLELWEVDKILSDF